MKIIHIAMDYDEETLSHLSPTRRIEFPRAAKHFADLLSLCNIPTIWVAAGEEGIYKFAKTKHEKESLNIVVSTASSDLIFAKGHNNVFFDRPNSVLQDFLRHKQINTIVMSGAYSRFCVPFSIFGAYDIGFERNEIIVVKDLIADPNETSGLGSSYCTETNVALLKQTCRQHFKYNPRIESRAEILTAMMCQRIRIPPKPIGLSFPKPMDMPKI